MSLPAQNDQLKYRCILKMKSDQFEPDQLVLLVFRHFWPSQQEFRLSLLVLASPLLSPSFLLQDHPHFYQSLRLLMTAL